MGKRKKINQWIEGLYLSTINKVHHEWRLQRATCPRPRYGEKLPSPQKMAALFASARMLAAEAFIIALFLE